MWNDFNAQKQLAGVKAGLGFLGASLQAKQDRKWQKYNNMMTRIQLGEAYGTIGTNKLLARRRAAEQQVLIQQSEMSTRASAEVAAAAAGVTGNSVTSTLFDISYNASQAQARVTQELEDTYLGLDNQWKNTDFNAKMQLDQRQISGPNPATYLLGFTNDLRKINERQEIFQRGIK